MVHKFTDTLPRPEDHWRAIILFGRNVASYKFALGKALLAYSAEKRTFVTLDELAVPFAQAVCEHLKEADRQGSSPSSKFLAACRRFNEGELTEDGLTDVTAKLGFVNVIDAFHVVGHAETKLRFFSDERKGAKKGIRLTDELLGLQERYQVRNLPDEVDGTGKPMIGM